MAAEALIAELNAQRDAYVEAFARAHKAITDQIAESRGAGDSTSAGAEKATFDSATLPSPSSPTLQPPIPKRAIGSTPVSRRSSNVGGRRPTLEIQDNTGSGISLNYDASTITDDSETEDESSHCVTQRLPPQSFDHEHLREHLKSYDFDEHGRQILSNVFTDGSRLRHPALFPEHGETSEDKKNYSHYQIFDVSDEGVPHLVTASDTFDQNVSRSHQVWLAIKDINASATDPDEHAVGRITIAREPSPILFGALHLTFNQILDMDELFQHLVESEQSSVHLYRAFDNDERRRRSFVFNFEYYTIIGDDRQPMAWQLSDENKTASESHLPLSRCSSVIALTLFGKPIKKIRNSARRARKRDGEIYDPWQAWQVINIQCYPDWKARTDVHEPTKRYVNGPEAFLITILYELRDAQKRFEEIYRQISKLITPPLDFIFNEEMRNRRLFEDKEFTYTRRYFWAHQTLGSVNDAIQAMIDAYEDNFPAELWEGRHKTLWPLSDNDHSGRNDYWKKRLRNLKMSFTQEINKLRTLIKENNDRRSEIRFLRDQLFSGTSVMESRKSVELSEITIQQGHNVKLLTLVNIFFLPLTFSVSVFGMQNMPEDHSYWMFAVTTTSICVPFFLLIGSLNTTKGYHFWREKYRLIWYWMTNWGGKKKTPTDDGQPPVSWRYDFSRSMSASNGMDFREGRAGKVFTIDLDRESSRPDGPPVSTPEVAVTTPTLSDLVRRKPSVTYHVNNNRELKIPDVSPGRSSENSSKVGPHNEKEPGNVAS